MNEVKFIHLREDHPVKAGWMNAKRASAEVYPKSQACDVRTDNPAKFSLAKASEKSHRSFSEGGSTNESIGTKQGYKKSPRACLAGRPVGLP